MAIRPPKLNLPLLMLVVSALALSAGAQSAGRAIIFSTPQTDAEQPGKSPLGPVNSQPGILPGTLQAPAQLFDFNPPSDGPPLPASPGISAQQQRMQRLLNDRKNWILMTPEEILGSATTEKMLQPPERDALGREKNPTPLERFLQRESQARNGLTNGWHNDRDNSPWQFSRDRNGLNTSDPGRDSTMAAAQRLNEHLESWRIGDDPMNRNNKNFGWNFFKTPAPQMMAKPDLEQMAAMDRFRQLLDPSRAPATESSPDNKFSPVPQTTPVLDPYITQPDYVPNPAGASFTPLSSGIARPEGLTPLPGAVTNFLPPVAAPSWKPQPPPWLLQGPQPFVIPKQKGF